MHLYKHLYAVLFHGAHDGDSIPRRCYSDNPTGSARAPIGKTSILALPDVLHICASRSSVLSSVCLAHTCLNVNDVALRPIIQESLVGDQQTNILALVSLTDQSDPIHIVKILSPDTVGASAQIKHKAGEVVKLTFPRGSWNL